MYINLYCFGHKACIRVIYIVLYSVMDKSMNIKWPYIQRASWEMKRFLCKEMALQSQVKAWHGVRKHIQERDLRKLEHLHNVISVTSSRKLMESLAKMSKSQTIPPPIYNYIHRWMVVELESSTPVNHFLSGMSSKKGNSSRCASDGNLISNWNFLERKTGKKNRPISNHLIQQLFLDKYSYKKKFFSWMVSLVFFVPIVPRSLLFRDISQNNTHNNPFILIDKVIISSKQSASPSEKWFFLFMNDIPGKKKISLQGCYPRTIFCSNSSLESIPEK